MVFILVVGMLGLLGLKTTFFPERPNRTIIISTFFPGASPAEMEEGITSKIEENLVGIEGLKRTSSVSSENAATVSVEVERGADADDVIQDVKNAVDRISSFPGTMEPPVIYVQDQLSSSLIFSLSGDISLRSLKNHAEQIEDDLLAKDGISRIDISGFPDEEIEISFREQDMRALNITFDEAVRAVAGNNLLSTGGTIKTQEEEFLIRAENKNYYAQSFEDIIVRSSPNGGQIRLYQIADVKDQWADSPQRTFLNDRPSVVITVFNTLEEDMFDNSETTQAYLKEFGQRYPQIQVDIIRDGKEYLNGRISFIKENGLIGFCIVLLLLAMFLNFRIAFWVALAIPISFAGMFIAAGMLGITINVISTFGMVVVIGILVDDGIVIAENIYQHYEKGAPPMEAALEGTMEVLPAVTSAILTTVIAFSAFFFLDGFLGDVFRELAIVVIFTLIFSLIEGAFILPAHVAHSRALKAGQGNIITRFFDGIMDFVRNKLYGPILKLSMKYSFPAIGLCVVGMLISVGAFQGGFIKGTFFPNIEGDNFNITLELPAGTREGQVYNLMDSIGDAAWRVNERLSEKYYNGETDVIEKVQTNIGPNTYEGSMTIYLLEGEQRDSIRNRDIVAAIREELGPIDAAQKLVFGLGGIFGDPVSISLLSKNDDDLKAAVAELKGELGRIKDLRDIQDSNKEGLKELKMELKPKAYNLGFTLSDIIRYVRQGFFGAEIQRLQRGSDEVKVWVRYKLEDRSSLEDLANIRVRSSSGQSIPLRELVDFKQERGIININHIDGQKEIRVTADVAADNVSVSDVNADIQSIILPKVLEKYPAVKVGIEGQARDIGETIASMRTVIPIVLMCMFFVIILTFSSVSQAMIVFAILPFGFIGVAFGHWFMGVSISFLSILGVIALVGILVNDALVFISTFNVKIKNGLPFEQALYDTGVSRFRPITLTTLTTVAGLLPLMLEKSVQAQFLIPMAISVAFGLMIATFVLLVLLPALLSIANNVRLFTTSIWTGENLAPEMVEPAYPNRVHPWPLTLLAALFVLGSLVVLVMLSLKISQNLI